MSADFGAGFNPFDPEFRADPHAFFARAREQAPVCRNPFMGFWLITRCDDAMRALGDHELFSSQNKIGPFDSWPAEIAAVLDGEGYPVAGQLFGTDPPIHTRIRTLFLKGFTPHRIAAMEPAIRALAHELLDQIVDAGVADLRASYADPFPMNVILDLIGVPRPDHPRLKAWHDAWGGLYAPGAEPDALLASVRQVVAYQQYYAALIADRRRSPRDDLVSALVTAESEGVEPLTDGEMIWQLMGLLAAGHETTTSALTGLLLLLLRDGDQWKRLVADPDRIPAVVEEGVRYVNPVLGLPRVASADVDMGGTTIPGGSDVLVSFASINRDLPGLDKPEVFDPDRPNVAKHLGFGWGVHFCIGARLARLQLRVALEVLAERLPNLRLASGDAPEFAPHPFLWGPSALLTEWE